MRLLLIHQAFVSPGEAGGTRHFEFAQHLRDKGHEFTIIASDISYLTGLRVGIRNGLFTEQLLQGVRVLRAYTYPSLHRSFAWRVISFLSFMCTSCWVGLRAGPVDVVMGTSPPIFQAVSAWIVALMRRKPFLLEIRDLWPDFAIDIGVLKNSILVGMARWLESFLYRRASHLLVNSPAYRDHLLAKGIPAAKITLIANGVDPGMFNPADRGDRIRDELGLGANFVVTYAGALGLANDIPTILRAADRLRGHPDITFILLGDGKERHALEAAARQMELRNTRFVGARPKTDIPDFLAASDACVATLRDIRMFRTTYPNKVFDYMAAGRPTILAIDGVIRNVLEEADGGLFVPPGNDDALAQAVLKLKTNPLGARQMGASARKHVVEKFNRRQQAAEFACLIEAVRESTEALSGAGVL